ncbi:MAG: histidine phosphatase family protein [Alphaproteobacteria bacterium]
MTTLIIARHGNTFDKNDTPTRVGARTDLPLVNKGKEQALALGRYLKDHDFIPDAAYCSTLLRTQETAKIAIKECGINLPAYALQIFDEIDYGPDENKIEDEVIARIGLQAISDWDKHAIVPSGWKINPDEVIENWKGFARQVSSTHDTMTNNVMDLSETIFVVTSNGIARFAPHITDDFDSFSSQYDIKLATGALGILNFDGEKWSVKDWNIRP